MLLSESELLELDDRRPDGPPAPVGSTRFASSENNNFSFKIKKIYTIGFLIISLLSGKKNRIYNKCVFDIFYITFTKTNF